MNPINDKTKDLNIADILVIDDNADNLRYLSNVLTQKGYKVRAVINGKMAVEAAKLKPPDLILLDIMMPEIDGYEVCRRLKAIPDTQKIPIIFISAKNQVEDKIIGFDLGGADYITKPCDPGEILVRVQNQLKMSRLQQEKEEQNFILQREIFERTQAENALKELNKELESLVNMRTLELQEQNQKLLYLQEQLQEALQREHSISEFKSQLITTISHQFRTPLTVISTSSDLIKRKQAKGDLSNSERYFGKISQSIARITNILEDTLMLAKASSQDVQCYPVSLNLTEFCQSFINNFRPPENKNISLIFQQYGEDSILLHADGVLLKNMLNHLVENALNFSPNGGEIFLELIPQSSFVEVRVKDSGIGIPPEEKNKVFDLFYRASNANSVPGTPGTGLGLTVVQWVVQQHRGTIQIESELNQGTTFKIYLPKTLSSGE